MLLLIFVWITIIFMLIRLTVVLVNLITWPLLPMKNTGTEPFISLLIPARNEEENIVNLLNDIEQQPYKNIEVIVYNDESTDKTGALVKNFARQSSYTISLIEGKGLHEGWLGKNYACDQLAKQAKGDYLLFLDADVKVEENLLTHAAGYAQKHKLELLSIFPQQMMFSWGEKLTVPLMNWILVSFLPMRLIQYNKRPSFSAANGQFMLFNAAVYKQHTFHQTFKNHPVEDIAILRRMKELKLKTATLLSSGQIKCRMYQSFWEGVHGFSKNFIQFFGGNSFTLILFLLIISFGPWAIFFHFGLSSIVFYFLGVMVIKLLVAVLSKQSTSMNLILLPFHFIVLWIISIQSIFVKRRGKLFWKGRVLDIKR
jgi:glycosyltransferase involved in cell wall biosynthesis